ncbi:MAG: hypothetical protein R2753_17150 [Chitinophagales bacterium]
MAVKVLHRATQLTPAPEISVITPCGANYMDVQLSEAITCSSLSSSGSEFILTGPGGPFTVTGASGVNCGLSTSQLTLNFTPQVIIGSTYTLTINSGVDGNTLIDNCGNATTVGSSLTFVATPPNAVILGPGSVCLGSSITLSATGGTSYLWSTGDTTSYIEVSPTSQTTYTVIIESGSCVQSASKTVNVRNSPTADFSFLPIDPCVGEQVHFDNYSDF